MINYFSALAVSSFILGAMHALEPGHGKTLVAAYLVGSRGKWYHAVYLGIVVTLTHTAGILVLAGVTLYAADYLAPDTIMWYMEILSGLLILGIGIIILRSRLRWTRSSRELARSSEDHKAEHAHDQSHSHNHEHSHDHDHHYDQKDLHSHSHLHTHHHGGLAHHHHHGNPQAVRHGQFLGGLTALGISGGIIPCPAALAVLLAAISMGHAAQGFLLVFVFSLGLASVLIALGLLVVFTASAAGDRFRETGIIRWMPVVSAAVVTLLGVILLVKAFVTGVPSGVPIAGH